MGFPSIDQTPAQRRHTRRILTAMGAYAVLLVPVVWLRAHPHVLALSGGAALALSALPAAAIIAMFASYNRYLAEETDEYVRLQMIRQILFATNIALSCAVLWGFLSELGGMTPIANYWIAVVWTVAQGIHALIAARRARAGDGEA